MRNFGNVLQNAAEIVSDAKRQNTRKNADFHFLGVPLSRLVLCISENYKLGTFSKSCYSEHRIYVVSNDCVSLFEMSTR